MNTSNGYTTYSSQQPSSGNTAIGNSADNFFAGSMIVITFAALFGLIIFIIWVWSMLSMIDLNHRVRDFIEEYRWNEAEKDPSNSDIIDEAHDKKRVLANYKTEEQSRAEIADKLVKLKPRKLYMWIAVSIPILFAILLVVISLNN